MWIGNFYIREAEAQSVFLRIIHSISYLIIRLIARTKKRGPPVFCVQTNSCCSWASSTSPSRRGLARANTVGHIFLMTESS
jgi:hypothetical protein